MLKQYILITDDRKQAEIVSVNPKISSEEYANIQKKFADVTNTNWLYNDMLFLDEKCKIGNVYFMEELTPEGMNFTLLKMQNSNTEKDIAFAIKKLYAQRDVVSLKIIDIKSIVNNSNQQEKKFIDTKKDNDNEKETVKSFKVKL